MPKKSIETQDTKVQEAGAATQATAADEANLLNAPVVTLPKFNPHARPVATEQVSTTPIRQSYEEIQQEAKGPGSDEWRAADKARAKLTELYRDLQEDERFATEYKSQRAWEEYEKAREQIEQLAPTAREKMRKSADSLERLSIPTPEHESLITQDTNKLLLTAHERNRLEGLLDRAEKQAERTKGQFKRDPQAILKAEYERGLSEGGPGGGATVRAVYQLARDRGLDIHAIVDEHRRPSHHGALEDAERARMRANLVGRSVPEPPFAHPLQGSRSKDVGTYGAGGRMFVGRGPVGVAQRKPGASRRRPYWR
jgi:hypothetical protein